MRLWAEGSGNGIGRAVRATVKEQVADINRKVIARGVRAVNALRNAELEVLKGQRSGRVYRKPYTKKATYTASAPGEPPARRTGNLRLHWNGEVKSGSASGKGASVIAALESGEPYAVLLEKGTSKMAARPFVERIKEKAAPELHRIFSGPYT